MGLVHKGCGGEVSLASCVRCGADFLGASEIGPSSGDYRATVRLNPDPSDQEGDRRPVAAPGVQVHAPTTRPPTLSEPTSTDSPTVPIDGLPLGEDELLWPVEGDLPVNHVQVPGEG